MGVTTPFSSQFTAHFVDSPVENHPGFTPKLELNTLEN